MTQRDLDDLVTIRRFVNEKKLLLYQSGNSIRGGCEIKDVYLHDDHIVLDVDECDCHESDIKVIPEGMMLVGNGEYCADCGCDTLILVRDDSQG